MHVVRCLVTTAAGRYDTAVKTRTNRIPTTSRHRPTIGALVACGLMAGLLVGVAAPTRTPAAHADFLPTAEPRRLLDTRPASPTYDGQAAGAGVVGAGRVVELVVGGRAGIPTNAASVVLNVTVTQPQSAGFVTVYPCDAPRPTASNLNYAAGQTIANTVVTRLGAGKVCLFTLSPTHLIVDIAGELPANAFAPLPEPRRLLDSRPGGSTYDGQSAAIGIRSGVTRVKIAGRAGLAADAQLIVLNVTVTEPTAPGFITVYPCAQEMPTASNLNYATGQTIPNAVVTALSAGDVCIYTLATTHLVVDAAGTLATTTFIALPSPRRIFESRLGLTTLDRQYEGTTALPSQSTVTLRVGGRSGIPSGASSVILNVTATGPTAPGFVTAHPRGSNRPTASNLNYDTNSTIANLVVARLGAGGDVCLFTQANTHLVVDVIGYLTGPAQVASAATCPGPAALTLTSTQRRALLNSSPKAYRVLSFSTTTLTATIQETTWDIPRQRYVFGAPTSVTVSPQFLYIRWANMPGAGYSSAAEFERWVPAQRISDVSVTDFKLAFSNGALIAAAVEYDGAGECEEPLPPADDNCF